MFLQYAFVDSKETPEKLIEMNRGPKMNFKKKRLPGKESPS